MEETLKNTTHREMLRVGRSTNNNDIAAVLQQRINIIKTSNH
jgi:hypothetical protein